jgi:protein ImuB
VEVTGRGELTAEPVRMRSGTAGRPALDRPALDQQVTAWSGPWPCDELWWDPAAHRRRARLQVVLDDGVAHLLTREGGRWFLEATYD